MSNGRALDECFDLLLCDPEEARVIINGKERDLEVAAMYMDDDIRESLHSRVDNPQDFVDAYAKAHAAKFGEPWVVD